VLLPYFRGTSRTPVGSPGLFEFRVDDIIGAGWTSTIRRTASSAGCGSGCLAVGGRSERVSNLLQIACELPELRQIRRIILQLRSCFTYRLLSACSLVPWNAIAKLPNLPFDLIGGGVSRITHFHFFATPFIFIRVCLRISHHSVDFFFRELSRSANRNLLFFPGFSVFRRDSQNAVGVNVEGDFYLRHVSGRRAYAFQAEMSQRAVGARKLAFTLEHVDIDSGLIVFSRGEDF
jgi:hypothetical protein